VIHLIRPVGLVASSPALVRSRRLLRFFLRVGTGRDFRGVVVVVLGLSLVARLLSFVVVSSLV